MFKVQAKIKEWFLRLCTIYSVKHSAVTSQCDLSRRHTLQNTGKITNFSEPTLHDRLNHNFAVTHSATEVADIYDCLETLIYPRISQH